MNTIEKNNTAKVSLVDIIEMREQNIEATKIELLQLWIDQGTDLQKLKDLKGCSQNQLTELTGISKGSIFNYIQLSKDKRILQFLDTGHHGDHLIEDLNQKKLVKLTKLDDEAFDTYLETGTYPTIPMESEESAVMDVVPDDNATIDEQIEEKEAQIQQLKDEIHALKKQFPNDNATTAPKAIVQFTQEGVFLAEFSSASVAGVSTGVDMMTIGEVCRGVGSLAGGFVWRFENVEEVA